jgi:hypothetical protein
MLIWIIFAIIVGLVIILLLINLQVPGVIGETLDKVKIALTPKPPMPRSERIELLKARVAENETRIKDMEAAAKKRKEEQLEEFNLRKQLIVTQNKAKILSRRRG